MQTESAAPSPRPFEFGGTSDSETCSFNETASHLLYFYFVGELGWTNEAYKERLRIEIERDIPRGVVARLEEHGWKFTGKRVLDVGSGLGGLVQELHLHGAEGYGAEPSSTFVKASIQRLREAGVDSVIHLCPGEDLEFADASFDYVISLQVLEHVSDPAQVMSEIWRVLKPGGQAFVSCENYLSLREMHYRVPWAPLLPKRVGALYLRSLGRNPDFLMKHVTYVTYPGIKKIANDLGFRDLTIKEIQDKLSSPMNIQSSVQRRAIQAATRVFPNSALLRLAPWIMFTFRVGTRMLLEKPAS